MRLPRWRTPWILGCVLALVAVLVVAGVAAAGDAAEPVRSTGLRVEGVPEPDGTAVTLDARIYLPATTPAPAVLLAHGYGGSLASVATEARALAGRGYVVLTWSARGFGGSGGQVHLDSPDFEVKDAQRLLDLLGARPEVQQDSAGDPRVGAVGASYGGALALLLAGTDRRVDAVVPSITWNELGQALFPQFVTGGPQDTPAAVQPAGGPGVFKKQWTALLFGASSGVAGGPAAGAGGAGRVGAGTGEAAGDEAGGAGDAGGGAAADGPALPDLAALAAGSGSRDAVALRAACGRLAVDLCLGYVAAATGGRPTEGLLKLLAASSPARVADRITAPTLLIQGQTDSLFPLSEADANARAIASAGTDVRVYWEAGGHDGGNADVDRIRRITADFLDRVLEHRTDQTPPDGAPTPGFRVTVPDAVVSISDADPAPQSRSTSAFPGLDAAAGRSAGLPLRRFRLEGGPGLAVSPPGAAPAALTSLPGAGGALGLLSGAAGSAAQNGFGGGGDGGGGGAGAGTGSAGGFGLGQLPGQNAGFETAPLPTGVSIVGSSRVRVRITSTAADATLFASLLDVAPDGGTTLPRQLVSPVRVAAPAGTAREVTIALPAVVRDVPAGHRLRVVLASTDQGYALPAEARGYLIQLAGDRTLSVPVVALEPDEDDGSTGIWFAAAALALASLLVVAAFALRNRRVRRRTEVDVVPELVDVPLAITGLGKAYGDGFRAVSDLSFRVEAGQVLGLLGPNGAGKTTTLRMLTGLILPTEGEIRIFGHRVTPGAAVLSRLGSFIEGPGFLPHLSGLDNLRLYWRATGRGDADSHLDTALEIAGLSKDVHRKVRTYSQGMRQRLAIAQAMLGLPDLLVMDEPTNGLDPPQIREMREVLGRYAATGRTVLVSSHLLSEVEQSCSHVVVMANGRLVAQGPVAELVGAGASPTTEIDVEEPGRATGIAARVDGVDDVQVTDTGLLVRADAAARGRLVAELVRAGLRVDRVSPRRGLEETFLTLIGEAR